MFPKRPLPPGCGQEESDCHNLSDVSCDGNSHDATCSWHCKDRQVSSEFCQGGMDMLMDGFGFGTSGGEKNRLEQIIIKLKPKEELIIS